MEKITSRQGQILAAIVKEYSQKGEPVGSEDLAEKYRLDVSSATVRNEMKALEKVGFITQPHTSAGRVPTDQGYRYFVNKLMRHLELSTLEQQRLRQELVRLKGQYLELGHSISKLLSDQAQGAAFALLPESVSTSGLAKVMEQDVQRDELKELARFLEELDTHSKTLIKKDFQKVETFIGKEAPIPLASDFSLVVTKVNLPGGQHGVIGIVGPKRMKYARNISLLEYISKLLSSGLGVYFLVHLHNLKV
jgi:heat-inducible transcriptional repressor